MSRTYRKRKYTFSQQVDANLDILKFSEQKLYSKCGKYYTDSYNVNIEEVKHYHPFYYEEHKNYKDKFVAKHRREANPKIEIFDAIALLNDLVEDF